MTWLDLSILILSCQRLTSLWFEEINRPIRERIVKRGGRWNYLASCPICISVWAGGVVVGLWMTPIQPVVIALAISGGVLFLDRITGLLGQPNPVHKVAQELAALRNTVSEITLEPVENGKR